MVSALRWRRVDKWIFFWLGSGGFREIGDVGKGVLRAEWGSVECGDLEGGGRYLRLIAEFTDRVCAQEVRFACRVWRGDV